MKFRMLILLSFFFPAILSASGKHSCGNRDNYKAKVHCKGGAEAPGLEAFVFVLPSKNKKCDEKKDFRTTVINFYKWYLQNEAKITAGLSNKNKGKDLMPPFNISRQTLHEYFEVIQERYPNWISGVDAGHRDIPSSKQNIPGTKPDRISEGDSSPTTNNFSNLAK